MENTRYTLEQASEDAGKIVIFDTVLERTISQPFQCLDEGITAVETWLNSYIQEDDHGDPEVYHTMHSLLDKISYHYIFEEPAVYSPEEDQTAFDVLVELREIIERTLNLEQRLLYKISWFSGGSLEPFVVPSKNPGWYIFGIDEEYWWSIESWHDGQKYIDLYAKKYKLGADEIAKLQSVLNESGLPKNGTSQMMQAN